MRDDEVRKRRNSHRNITKNVALMKKVVRLKFHHDGGPSFVSNREVAGKLKISVPAVTKLLEAAYERGMFTVIVSLPQEETDVTRLEESVRSKFGLKDVLLVPGDPDMLKELTRQQHRNVQTGVLRAMIRRFAVYFDALIATHVRNRADAGAAEAAPYVIGVAWGRTMHMIADYLLCSRRDTCSRDVEFVPIIGITSHSNREGVEANVVAIDFARAYGGHSSQLPSPAFVERLGHAAVVRQQPQVSQMLKKIADAKVVVTGMGPILPHVDDAPDITLSNDPAMNALLAKSARDAGAIGDICYSLYDRDGQEVRTDYDAIGLGFQGLRAIARDRDRRVILVAGGDKRRFAALKVALQAGLASALVTDTVTARFLVGEI